MTEAATANLASKAGKYLTFKLARQSYAIEILKVQEIIGLVDITTVPKTPAYVRGVINLRGRILPIIDLRAKFEMEEVEDTDRTCIVIVQVNIAGKEKTVGIVIDEVSEVLEIVADQLEAPPEIGSTIDDDFISAMGKLDGKVLTIIDIANVLRNSRDLPGANLG